MEDGDTEKIDTRICIFDLEKGLFPVYFIAGI